MGASRQALSDGRVTAKSEVAAAPQQRLAAQLADSAVSRQVVNRALLVHQISCTACKNHYDFVYPHDEGEQ